MSFMKNTAMSLLKQSTSTDFRTSTSLETKKRRTGTKNKNRLFNFVKYSHFETRNSVRAIEALRANSDRKLLIEKNVVVCLDAMGAMGAFLSIFKFFINNFAGWVLWVLWALF